MSTLAGRGLVSMTFAKQTDSRKPVKVQILLTNMDGEGYAVDLTEHDLALLLSSSVLEVKIEEVL